MKSANTLFHFTPSKRNLLGILNEGFYPKYSKEDINVLPTLYYWYCEYVYIPMVCFCDITLSQIKPHMEKYGYYGIGLKKEWGIRNGLNPVSYVIKKSDYYKAFDKIVNYLGSIKYANAVKDEIQEYDLSQLTVWHLPRFQFYSKPYKGNLYRKDEIIHKVNFYEEREWRFIPQVIKSLSSRTYVWSRFPLKEWELEERGGKERFKEYNYFLKKYFKLKYQLNDIKYIIVKNDKEIKLFQEKLNKSKKGRNFPIRIISSKNIIEDF